MSELDLWGNLEGLTEIPLPETSDAVNILRQQARVLGKKTGGKIKGSFTQIQRQQAVFQSLGEKLSDGFASRVKTSDNAEEIKELDLKRDFGSRYEKTEYQFEIYNETYRYRVFTLKNSEEFPISISVDEGIAKEMPDGYSTIELKSNSELEECVRAIFKSNKLKNILARMMQG